MESKYSGEDDLRSDGKDDKDYYDGKDDKDEYKSDPPKLTVTAIQVNPKEKVEISSFLELKITFELDRDVVAAYWVVQFLVDSCYKRIIKQLGETPVEDYPDGESDMVFSVDAIDISNIEPSTLSNSGLLMAVFMVDGEEVAAVNLVSRILSIVQHVSNKHFSVQ